MAEVANRSPRALAVRAVRHGLLATALVLAVCAALVAVSATGYAAASSQVAGLTARASGKITAADGGVVRVGFTAADGTAHSVAVPLSTALPKPGTGTDVAYDPANPDRALVPGAQVFADGERATGGLVFGVLVAALVLLAGAWRLVSRARLTRRPRNEVELRRVRVQRGLLARSWLETERGSTWIPVYFDPVLVTMPSPATVRVHGDLRTDRLVAVEYAGVVLYPSGRVVRGEPRGRRLDNPVAPDATAASRAVRAGSMGRQLRVDAVACVAAPFVGLLWAYADRSGFVGWVGATVLTGAFAFWLWAFRGSDPS